MISKGEITESRALEIAREYFQDTSARLFGIDSTALFSQQHSSTRDSCDQWG